MGLDNIYIIAFFFVFVIINIERFCFYSKRRIGSPSLLCVLRAMSVGVSRRTPYRRKKERYVCSPRLALVDIAPLLGLSIESIRCVAP